MRPRSTSLAEQLALGSYFWSSVGRDKTEKERKIWTGCMHDECSICQTAAQSL